MRAATILCCAIAAAVLSACSVDTPTDEDRAKPFLPHMSAYLDASGLTDEAVENGGYIVGKVLAISTTDRRVAFEVLTWLPHELRAQTPAEVGTLIWLEWGDEQAASYEVRSTGKVLAGRVGSCRVTVIDQAARRIVGRAKILGAQPDEVSVPESAANGGLEVVTERPLAEVFRFVEQLPRR